MTTIMKMDASTLDNPDIHAKVLLRLMRKLRQCEREGRPAILTDFLLAAQAFPERLEMSHQEALTAYMKHLTQEYRFEGFNNYITMDLENDGPVARLINLSESFRSEKGLASPLLPQQLFDIYNQRYKQKGHTDDISSIDVFLDEVAELDALLRQGKFDAAALGLFDCCTQSGLNRAPYCDAWSARMQEAQIPGTVLVDLGGGVGLDAYSAQEKMKEKGAPFKRAIVFDAGTPDTLKKFLSDYSRTLSKEDLYSQLKGLETRVAEKIDQNFGFDLREDNLVEKCPSLAEETGPILYNIQHVTSHYQKAPIQSMLERLNDVADAKGSEPESYLCIFHGTFQNLPVFDWIMLHLNTGEMVAAGHENGKALIETLNEAANPLVKEDDFKYRRGLNALKEHLKRVREESKDREKTTGKKLENYKTDFEALCNAHEIKLNEPDFSEKTWVRGTAKNNITGISYHR